MRVNSPLVKVWRTYCGACTNTSVPWDKRACAAAAEHTTGLECLQYAPSHDCPWDASTTTTTARAGQLDILHYALANHCPCDIDTSLAAAEKGDLEVLKLLHQTGCLWDERVSLAAAASDNIACLHYCVEHGCPISTTTMVMYNNSS